MGQLERGDKIFYGTATVTKVTRDRISINCEICGEDSEFTSIAYDKGNVNMCIKCKYGDTAKKAQKIMRDNRKKIEAEKKKEEDEKKEEEYNRNNKGSLKVVGEIDEIDYQVKCKTCGETYKYRKEAFDDAKQPLCLKCSTRGNYRNREGETFANLKIVRELARGEVECECSSCLAVNEYKKTEVINKTVKCKSCKNEGVNINEYKGSIVNNLYIIRDQTEGRKAAAYCTICGRVGLYEIGTIIDGTAECRCSTEQTKLVCRFCGKRTFILNPKTGEAKCEDKRCTSAVYVRGIQGEIDVQKKLGLYHIIYKEEYGKNVDRLQYEIVNDVGGQPTLVVYKNIIYVGTNERKFFKAFCLRHQKHLILQEEEIENGYDHTMCSIEYDLNIDEY